MKKVAGKAFLNYDELITLLIEIEQTLNTRSLTYLSDNNEDDAITPSHLLYGQNIIQNIVNKIMHYWVNINDSKWY